MSSSGPNYPSTAVNDTSTGTIPWVTPELAETDNDVGTQAWFDRTGQYSNWLKVTDFGFAIPGAAVIDGIVVKVKRKRDSTLFGIFDKKISLVKAGSILTYYKANPGSWYTAFTEGNYGGVSDLWDTTWAPAQINASDFGVAVSAWSTAGSSGSNNAHIDYVRVTVYYHTVTAYTRSAAGSQPAASGALTRVAGFLRSLAGNHPASSAVLGGVKIGASRSIAGDQPAATGTLTRGLTRSVAGNQPANTGALTRTVVFHRNLAGAQPASIGWIAYPQSYLYVLKGAARGLASKFSRGRKDSQQKPGSGRED